MSAFVWVILCLLCAAALALLGRMLALRYSLREIESQLAEILALDTNALITVSSRDKTARRLAAALNRELRALRAERLRLQNGDAELKTAITNLSHDLRTPLTAINGYLDLLKGECDLPTITRYLDIIRERTDAMRSLTEELFRYSVVTSAENKLHPAPLSLNDELAQSLAAFYGVLTEKGITPQISMPDTPVARTLDAEALRRVFGNILANAAKYSAGDLSVTLTDDGEVTFANHAAGLTAVDAQRLFERFYTVEAARHSTGLGLAIAKHLTESMGGKISAEYAGDVLSVRIKFGK